MPKAKLKTKKTRKSVDKFVASIKSPKRRQDAEVVLQMMRDVTGDKGAMWGERIVGFVDHTYHYKSGRVVDFFMIGFSSGADRTTIYIMSGYKDMAGLLKKLGPHSKGAGCLYLKDLDTIHLPTLKKIMTRGYKGVLQSKK